MWNFADDAGRMAYSPKTLKAQIYPCDEIKTEAIKRMVDELSSNGLLQLYVVDSKEFISITGWRHQKIDKPRPSVLPDPFDERSTNSSRMVAPDLILSDPILPDRKGSKDSDADASDADASIDHRKRLFSEGLEKLARITGKGPDACRSFVGKCLKAASDDAVTVLGLIEDAERNQTVDPAAWISARLKPKDNSNGRRTVHDAAREFSRNLLEALDQPAPGLCEPAGGGAVRLLPPR
jgi:hypothetical protein